MLATFCNLRTFGGIIVDLYGLRATFLLICSLIIMTVHLVLGLTYMDPLVPLIFLGLSYSMYGVAIWPSIATIAEHEENVLERKSSSDSHPKLVGTAFGISQSALNIALTIFPIVSAGIRVEWGSFVAVEVFFAGLAFLGALASLLLWYLDLKNESILQMPEISKKVE